MSFSSAVKKELFGIIPSARHCEIAEIAGIFRILGSDAEPEGSLSIRTENPELARKVFTLIIKAFNIDIGFSDIGIENYGKKGMKRVIVPPPFADSLTRAMNHAMLLSMECCRQSFLRGAFLSGGSISTPEKYYHLEIVCPSAETADKVQAAMRSFDLDAKIIGRKKSFVVYLKEGEQIVTMVGKMGAGLSFLNLESLRVEREMKGIVNRRVNCETANLKKTAVSSVRQIRDIEFIRDHSGFSELSPALRDIAEIRLKYPEASLKELGGFLDPKIGKSGVNHRLRKLGETAAELRKKF